MVPMPIWQQGSRAQILKLPLRYGLMAVGRLKPQPRFPRRGQNALRMAGTVAPASVYYGFRRRNGPLSSGKFDVFNT
jgi:hypothetical protein